MRAGLRPQIVLLLALVLVVSFVPLYFAVSTYTTTAHAVMGRQQAIELAETVATSFEHVPSGAAPELGSLLQGRVVALRHVALETRFASAVHLPSLPELGALGTAGASAVVTTRDGTWVGLGLSSVETLWVLVKDQPSILSTLNGLLLSYMAISGLVLLAGVYFLVTYRMIRPLEELSHAARRVTETDRPLLLPHPRSAEFAELNVSLQAMTDRLLREEAALRHKITEVETRTQQLRSAQAQLIRSERLASVGQLAAGVAHEIGNPIAALMGLQDLILHGGLSPEEQSEFVRRMRKETERIHRIVRDLLHFARAKPTLAPEVLPSASLASAVEETLGLLGPQPAFRELTTHTEIAPDLPHVVAAQEALVQIFLNLLLNAAAACAPNGEVRIAAKSWTAPGETQARFVEVSVEDNGAGVPEALRETLFEPFVSGKDVGEGTGLGLSVCRNLVDQIATATGLAAVTLELDHAFTSGARFILRLPISSHTN